ncbi:MAG: trk system potassium uptake protein TrkH [Spirochaetes bacterium]|nr:MAG: trk system potassium uptake protein TrkH [Spirochaetota bacterium]
MGKNIFLRDCSIVLHYTGKIIAGLSMLCLIPALTSLIAGEFTVVVDFLIGFGAMLMLGAGLAVFFPNVEKPNLMHGMVTAGISWLVAMIVAALPYWLSGHYLSYLDAMFDVMSGLTTTGLVLMQNLDHAAIGINMWRHILTFVGGQGIIVLALALFSDGAGGGFGFYAGEGKDERLFPSVMHTAKSIWKISLIYLVVGSIAFWLAGMAIGLSPSRAFLHGIWMHMTTWSTGGFAPMSQNILYYHSGLYEALTFVFFTIGSFNFALHASVLRGNRRELMKNIETVSFTITLMLTVFVIAWGLGRLQVYPDLFSMMRKGFYHIASTHTTTGLMTIYPQQFANEWGDLAMSAIIIAMMIGGSACSTAGGFKGLRFGILFKALLQEINRMVKPRSSIVLQKYSYFGRQSLSDQQIRNASLIVLMYVVVFSVAVVGSCAAGFPLLQSMFEAASVTGNVGLSIGVTTAAIPSGLKILYIFNMWAGRLEFMAVLASMGLIGSIFARKHR